jgi:hypothetical protein
MGKANGLTIVEAEVKRKTILIIALVVLWRLHPYKKEILRIGCEIR